MAKIIFLIFFLLIYLFTFGFAFVIFYHLRRFRPLVSLKEKKILTFLFLGQLIFFLLSFIFLLLI